MSKEQFFGIVNHAKELCREIVPQNQFKIKERNESIVDILSREDGIDPEIAQAIFENNNDPDELEKIYVKYYCS